jgi:hypothetical protein
VVCVSLFLWGGARAGFIGWEGLWGDGLGTGSFCGVRARGWGGCFFMLALWLRPCYAFGLRFIGGSLVFIISFSLMLVFIFESPLILYLIDVRIFE